MPVELARGYQQMQRCRARGNAHNEVAPIDGATSFHAFGSAVCLRMYRLISIELPRGLKIRCQLVAFHVRP